MIVAPFHLKRQESHWTHHRRSQRSQYGDEQSNEVGHKPIVGALVGIAVVGSAVVGAAVVGLAVGAGVVGAGVTGAGVTGAGVVGAGVVGAGVITSKEAKFPAINAVNSTIHDII